MFNSNYLGHNLIHLEKYQIDTDYICKKCGVEIFYEYFGNRDWYYYILDVDRTNGECNISCEDYIIKNIIE